MPAAAPPSSVMNLRRRITDDLVDARKQRRRHIEAEGLGGREINH